MTSVSGLKKLINIVFYNSCLQCNGINGNCYDCVLNTLILTHVRPDGKNFLCQGIDVEVYFIYVIYNGTRT